MFRINMYVIAAAIGILILPGCATANQQFGGTTDLKSHYESTVHADGSETTKVDVQAKGKAADVLEAVTSASLITKDGTGAERSMSFGANQNNDATLRGQLYVEAHRDDIEYRKAVAEQVTGLIGQGMQLAAPLVGQNISGNQANKAAEIQSKAATRQQLIESLRDPAVLQAIQSIMPAPIALPTPSAPVVRPSLPVTTEPPRLPSTPPVTPPVAEPTPLRDGTLPSDTNLSPEP